MYTNTRVLEANELQNLGSAFQNVQKDLDTLRNHIRNNFEENEEKKNHREEILKEIERIESVKKQEFCDYKKLKDNVEEQIQKELLELKKFREEIVS